MTDPEAGSNETLSRSFKSASEKDVRVSRVLMVGATREFGSPHLSNTDHFLLRLAVQIFKDWQIPVSGALDIASELDRRRSDAPVPHSTVCIINLHDEVIIPGEKGLVRPNDFLQSSECGDVIILCNIPKDVPEEFKFTRKNAEAWGRQPDFMRKAFAASPLHNDVGLWREQIRKSGAKIVYNPNSDGFDLDSLNDGRFVKIMVPDGLRDEHKCVGMLVLKEYLEDLGLYHDAQSRAVAAAIPSPLRDALVIMRHMKDIELSYDAAARRIDIDCSP